MLLPSRHHGLVSSDAFRRLSESGHEGIDLVLCRAPAAHESSRSQKIVELPTRLSNPVHNRLIGAHEDSVCFTRKRQLNARKRLQSTGHLFGALVRVPSVG